MTAQRFQDAVKLGLITPDEAESGRIGRLEDFLSYVDDCDRMRAAEEGEDKAPRQWPEPLNLDRLLSTPPLPPQFIVEGSLPAGYATLFGGHGGAGKSSIALHLATCIATGRAWWGRHCTMRRVLYLSCEDRADILHWRLARILRHENLGASDLGNLYLLDLVGRDTTLFRKFPTGAAVAAAYGELQRLIAQARAEVVFVDGTADTFAASENDRGEVKAFVNALLATVGQTGAVVLIAHVNKLAAGIKTAEGYSGSTAWHNSVRARWYLYPETERTDDGAESTDRLVLQLQKNNLGPVDLTLRFEWDDAAQMFTADETAAVDSATVSDNERAGIVTALRTVIESGGYVPAATTGPRTAYHVLSAASGFPDALKNRHKKRRFWRHVEELRAMGVIGEGSITRPDRHIVITLCLKAAPDNGAGNAGNADKKLPADTPQAAYAGNAGIAAGGYRGSARTHTADEAALDYLRIKRITDA